ncbi:MAG: 1-hydroxy-2-glutathionyl-2-methyl-3-butene dehydrogenase, partial [Nevskia sp.]|nr:1-hydroxy-2-glutathionyl-2-methyl-3-butene dehydrogenase [Nevskia sp.]
MTQTVLVTGADRGIGAVLCLQFAARGDRAIAACFGNPVALKEHGVELICDIDITTDVG